MKKIVTLLLTAVLGLGLTACAAGDTEIQKEPETGLSGPVVPVEPTPVSQPIPVELPDPEPVWTAMEGVTFSLLQDTYPVGATELTLVIDNRSDLEIGWGTYELYEKYVDGQWQKLAHSDEICFTDVMLTLQPQSVRTRTLTALRLLEPLDEGLYRVTGSTVFAGCEGTGAWQVTFRVVADAQPEPDYALYIAHEPIPTVEGCLVTDRIPAYFINTTGEDAAVLLIPRLEKQDENGAWNEVPWKEGVGFCGTPDPLPTEGKSWSWEISMLWGSLEDGRYRVGVRCQPYLDTEETVYGEFTLYTPENGAGLPLASQS